ncbi:hypothetical protein AB0O07_12460 [Streptomyces sp. NPDC093085]|uniref:hypothetical protein n=1 Tax=Streptomyces sp. NPDC093085 TaxID=3155068 RepID=UPI00341D1695
MAAATTTENTGKSSTTSTSAPTSSTSAAPAAPSVSAAPAVQSVQRKRLPAGRPREWYENHNRRLKAMRLAIALLDSGVYRPASAPNRRIRSTAARIGVHRPSNTTCRMVRDLIR